MDKISSTETYEPQPEAKPKIQAKAQPKIHITELLMKILAFCGVIIIFFIFVFVFMKAAPVIKASGIGLITDTGFDTQISEAFYAAQDAPMLTFGMLGLLTGTLLSTLIALVFSAVLGVGAAMVISEFAPRSLYNPLISLVRLLASIPSVIFGLVGIMTVVPWVEATFISPEMQLEFLDYFQMTGRNLFSSIIVLTFMIVPTVISLSVDALKSVPNLYKETGYAFGMSKFRVVSKIMLPVARPGIIAGFILGAGRGIGEAIAVSMVCGGIGMMPLLTHGIPALFTPILPLSAAIVSKSEAMSVPAVESALFACGAILLVLGTILSVTARLFIKKFSMGGGVHEG